MHYNEEIEIKSDSISTAKRLFGSTKYRPSCAEISNLAYNIELVERRGLSKLNKRLCAGGRNFWDTVAEHNFAVKLLNYHSVSTPIAYEPENALSRPPDFRVQIGNVTYWVQMKNSSKLERENRQEKIVRRIRDIIESVEISLFYSVELSKGFSEDQIQPLSEEILRSADKKVTDRSFRFPNDLEPVAFVSLWRPQKIKLKHLTLGIAGDMTFVEETGLAKEQMKNSLKKVAKAFEWPIDEKTLNLIAMDSSITEDIDLCDAAFGTEHDVIGANRNYWSRDNDGFFCLSPY